MNDPLVFVQESEQPSMFLAHSSMSVGNGMLINYFNRIQLAITMGLQWYTGIYIVS